MCEFSDFSVNVVEIFKKIPSRINYDLLRLTIKNILHSPVNVLLPFLTGKIFFILYENYRKYNKVHWNRNVKVQNKYDQYSKSYKHFQ